MFIETPQPTGRILSSREVYTGPIFSVVKQTIDTPDGLRVTRDLIRHAQAVALLAITPDDRVLVNREYRVGVNREAFALPAGLINAGEDVLTAAARELTEETGFVPGALTEMCAVHSSEGMTDELVHLVLARIDPAETTAKHFDQDEFVQSALVPLDEVVAAVKAGQITSAQSVSALGYYLAFVRH
ncbi:NUDIX hydrolase [Lacticaseibacillus kribbianus]|uniref:NUDIX hydrolase n=1 Tax=Lacticaseibacillus kribbianus TaxID=2926292 RepID=UPI001CD60B87|nr:NUDIX hydrolase [Lacticaseibacillus kribbianus]